MTHRLALPLALVLSTLTACGGEEAAPSADATAASETAAPAAATPSASGDNPEPCPWLSSETATGVLGSAVTVTRPTGYTSPCHVESSPFAWTGTLMIQEGDELASAASLRSLTPENSLDAAASLRGLTLEPIDGLGERAGWVSTTPETEGNGHGEILFEQGGHVFSVALSSAERSSVRPKAVALGQAIIDAM